MNSSSGSAPCVSRGRAAHFTTEAQNPPMHIKPSQQSAPPVRRSSKLEQPFSGGPQVPSTQKPLQHRRRREAIDPLERPSESPKHPEHHRRHQRALRGPVQPDTVSLGFKCTRSSHSCMRYRLDPARRRRQRVLP
jgi:hypothetical protein